MRLLVLTSIFYLGLLNCTFGQEINKKFGKLNEKFIHSNICPIDSEANAFYILNNCSISFKYSNETIYSDETKGSTKGFQLFIKKHFRIKILNKDGLNYANHEIALFRNLNNEEKISKIKGIVYNNYEGEIIKVKLNKSRIKYEESSTNIKTAKLSFPEAKVGSVIELEYTIVSDFYSSIPDWYFQSSIPTLQSVFTIMIPEYFNYSQKITGYNTVQTNSKSIPKEINITYKQMAEGIAVKEEKYVSTFKYEDKIFIYSSENLNSFRKERYLKNKDNYRTKIALELESTKFPNQAYVDYSTTWKAVDSKLLDHSKFGQELRKSNSHLNEFVNNNKLGIDKELIRKSLIYINTSVIFDEENSLYSSKNLKKSFNEGGNSADVNLNLVALLSKLGFVCYPVILSTQGNGYLNSNFPTINDFNYVIAKVELNGDVILLDATDNKCDINIIPEKCLNGKGRQIGGVGEKWIDLLQKTNYSSNSTYQITLNGDNSIFGNVQKKLKGYSIYEYEKKRENKSKADMSESNESVNDQEEYKLEIKNLILDKSYVNEVNQLKLNYDIKKVEHAFTASNKTYFSPIVEPFFDDNPFESLNRMYPVEFDYPIHLKSIYLISFPDNFTITSLPSSVQIKMKNNEAEFNYSIKDVGGKIMINSIFRINIDLIMSSKYAELREFMQMVIDKQKELITIEKR